MKAATLVKIVNESLGVIVAEAVDLNDEFREPTAAQDAIIAGKIIAICEAHGVNVDDRIEQVVASLPLILGFFGSA